ncbi:MAG: hypothetical protein MI924_15800, partial [Chloroflexales bacterium]|nr:hypothetical protein [Chloroflexales bacterium]
MLAEKRHQKLPAIFVLNEKMEKNLVQQLLVAQQVVMVTTEEFVDGRIRGRIVRPIDSPDTPILVVPHTAAIPTAFERVIIERVKRNKNKPDELSCEWAKHPQLADIPRTPINYEENYKDVIASWKGAFSYLLEDIEAG